MPIEVVGRCSESSISPRGSGDGAGGWRRDMKEWKMACALVSGISSRAVSSFRSGLPSSISRVQTPVLCADTLSLIHISEPTRLLSISYAVFCLKKKTTFISSDFQCIPHVRLFT
eukprot:TRINITY_DN59313_c0_g1_i2.p1 TRINITY_DN59313_c0_g1~~TRINITY_DN59313_c0_g1_i2.p1  ORF type:complete len:115 (+),score=16.51 TRINITY_DN59313_c0_g1_i2:219-563(+)